MPDGKTLAALFWDSVAAHGDREAQGWYEGQAWVGRSYFDFGRSVRDLANAMLAEGLRKGDRVAVWSKNSPRWAEVDFANQSAGFATVPIYDTLTPDKAGYILKDCGARILFVQDPATLEKALTVRSSLKSLDLIVVLDGDVAPAKGVRSYQQMVESGRAWGQKNPAALDKAVAGITPEDLASIVYTSGTTGEPKGVMLTHGNFASNSTSALSLVAITPDDVFLSFLPLSHVFERTGGHFAAYAAGAKVVFSRGLEHLSDDLVAVRPTLMMAVPRLYEKMHARMQAHIAKESWIKRRLIKWAIATGRETLPYVQAGTPIPAALARRHRRAQGLVLRKLQARVGGRLRYFVSGGAALSREIESFFWAAGIQILQGYGLTETAPVTHVNRPGEIRLGSVGKVIPGVECRIDASDWPQGTRTMPDGASPEGEICVRGPNVMKGYYGNARATKEVFDRDGWFHTGDVGYVDADGYLWITDRKKEILVMSNGKKVPPQAIENALQLRDHIAQACLLGDGRNYIAALVVPDWEAVERFALENGIAHQSRDRLAADPRVVSLIETEVEAVNANLSRYEQVKKFWIVPGEWSVESGELTPSLKLKRRVIAQKFSPLIDKLYPGEAVVTA